MIPIIIALLVAGLVLLLLEILTPTFGILIALGAISLAAAVWLCFRISSALGLVMIVALVITVPVYLVALVKWLPMSPLGKKLFLRKAPKPAVATPEAAEHEALVGRTGLAESLLRPTGAIRIEGHRVIATAETGIIQKGTKVKVIRAEGMNVVVRQVEGGA